MTEREVQCPQCSRSIVPGDSVFFEEGRLSHVSCHMPKTLTARCDACAQSFLLSELTADLSGRTHLCPRCRRDLTEIVRTHLYGCGTLPAEVRHRAQMLRDAAQHLVKESRRLRDQADVLIREAEVALEKSRRALWEALRTPHRG